MSTFTDAERDAQDLAKLVNEDTEVTTRYGDNPKKSIPLVTREFEESGLAAITELNKSRGFRVVGSFVDGFTYELYNDVGIDADGNSWIYTNFDGTPVNVTAGTVPSEPTYTQVIYEQVVKGGVEIKTPTVNPDTHMLFQPVDHVPIRVHWEPKGYIDNGVVSKFDIMAQPYDLDPVNYIIWNLYEINGDPHGTGEGTVIAFNAKGVGNNWGLWPSINFGFQDLGANAVCAKMWYGDHNQPAHYTPNKGNWREGKSFTSGDYATNNNDIFRAATTGVAGNTPPTHTSGTVSDGNIDWEFIYSPDFNTVRATYMFGDRADMPVLGHSDCRVQFRRNYLTGWGAQHKWLNSDGNLIFRFLAAATGGGANEWMHFETFGGGYERWHRTENYKQTVGLAITESAVTYNSGETNLDLAGVTLINFGNASATTVSTISNVKPNQLIKLESANGNTTIANSSTIRLIGNQDVTLNERTAIFLIADTSGTFLKQIGNESGNYKPTSVGITYNDLWGDADADPANSVQCLNDRGVVSLSGRADPNASPSTQIGTLPTGYRPVDRDAFVVTCDDAGSIVRLQFTTSGQILTNSIQDGIAFDGVTFVVER